MMEDVEYTKHVVVSDYDIYVYDNVISPEESAKMAQILNRSNFTRTELDRPDTSEFRSWAGEIEQEDIEDFPIYSKTTELLFHCFPVESYKLDRSYCNVALFGDMLFTHVDTNEEGSYTALWYISERWDVEWGGETLFFNNQKDAELAVSPRPGRVVLFDGRILHTGRPPNRICLESRFTVALKFEAFEL